MEIALAHRDHLAGATWVALGAKYGKIDGRAFRDHFAARGYPIVRRRPGRVPPQRIVVPADPAQLGYIAGLIDGEGYITCITTRVASGRIGWRLGIANTDVGLMDWLLETVPGSVRTSKRQRTVPKWPGNRLPAYEWLIRGLRDIRALLIAVEPYLVIKGDRAKRAIRDIEDRLQLNDRACDDADMADAEARIARLEHLSDVECRQILLKRYKIDAA